MPPSEPNKTHTEVVAVFDDPHRLQEAIDDLLSAGFDRAELSLLAGERTVEEKLGHAYRRVDEIEDDITIPRDAYVSTEAIGDAEGGLIGGLVYVGAVAAAGAVVATGRTLAAVIGAAAMAGGAGALIGSVLATLIGEHHARHLQEQLNRGGLLLWVRTWDEAREARAKEVLKRHSGRDVHAHSLSTALAARQHHLPGKLMHGA